MAPEHALERGVRRGAMRASEIRELDDRDRGVVAATAVQWPGGHIRRAREDGERCVPPVEVGVAVRPIAEPSIGAVPDHGGEGLGQLFVLP